MAYVPPGYGLLQHDRIFRQDGGVALIFREDFVVSVIRSSSEDPYISWILTKAEYMPSMPCTLGLRPFW